ncbi:MAG TPA: hypothetical protein VD902_20050, partial [Symbiobacteriaceae bacterium]|nr:hypothetical protein [Symbiobacteriaceae bacterium]
MDSNNAPTPEIIVPDLDQVEIQYRHQYDSGAWFEDPARSIWSALASKRLGALSMEAGHGTDRPAKVLIMTDRHNLYFAPVTEHPQAVTVSWNDGRAYMNLIKIFTYLKRVLPPDTREFYKIVPHDKPIDIGNGVTVKALKMPLKRVETRHKETAAGSN